MNAQSTPVQYHSAPEAANHDQDAYKEVFDRDQDGSKQVADNNQVEHIPVSYGGAQQNDQHRFTFALLPFLLGLLPGIIIMGAALGGGLGSSLASCNNDKNSLQKQLSNLRSTNCTSASNSSQGTGIDLRNYTVAAANTVIEVYVDCPAENQQTYTTHDGYRFTTICGIDLPPGLPASGGGTISHIGGIIAYKWQDCVEACGSYNAQIKIYGGTNKTCAGISFAQTMQNFTTLFGSNCWLKNATLEQGTQGAVNNFIISAMIQ